MKTYFRISLMEGSTAVCDTVALLAAQANGGRDLKLNDIYIAAAGDKVKYPTSNENTSIELMSDTLLHIDRKIGEEYKTVCIIEQVEIGELASVDDLEEVNI